MTPRKSGRHTPPTPARKQGKPPGNSGVGKPVKPETVKPKAMKNMHSSPNQRQKL